MDNMQSNFVVATTRNNLEWRDMTGYPHFQSGDQRLSRIESLLGIPYRNPFLESKYSDLKKAGDDRDRELKRLLGDMAEQIQELNQSYDLLERNCLVAHKMQQDLC